MKILLATGFDKLEKLLRTRFTDVDFEERSVLFREGVDDVMRIRQPDIVIISELLEGNTLSHEELIKMIRNRHPKKRIIYILKDSENIKMRKFLYKLGVYDVFSIKPILNLSELRDSFDNPKQWEDVYHYFGGLDTKEQFIDDMDFDDEEIEQTEYSSFETKTKVDIDSLYMQLAAFWSVRDQSGKTYQAINTALMLAQNNQQKILLLDFNIDNANMHLQFGFNDSDGNHNLGAVIEDTQEHLTLTPTNLMDYLIVHSTYKNLHLLPGYILKMEKPTEDAIISTFDKIIEVAAMCNYTSVLIDCNSDLNEEHTRHILEKSHKIFTTISESPCSVFAVRRCFDREVGPFFTNFLNQNKLVPILNQSAMDDKSPKFIHLIQSILEAPIEIVFPYDERIRQSVVNGQPLLKSKPDEDMYYNFVLMANHIHNIFVVPPNPFVSEEPTEKKTKKGVFSNLFKKNK